MSDMTLATRMELTELGVIDDSEPWDDDPYSIKEPGSIVFEVVTNHASVHQETGKTYRTVEIQALECWGNACWAQEGIGLEDWVRDYAFEPWMAQGTVWIVEDMEVHFIRGDGWTTDDDEEWYSGPARMLMPWHYRQNVGQYHRLWRRWLATLWQPYRMILRPLFWRWGW